jgi:hypothetical protein
MRVSLIGTVHAESGLANVSALRALLEQLLPEVIFVELPSDALRHHLDGTDSNLESTAIRHYRQNRHVVIVPVDRPKPDEAFFTNAEDMFTKVDRTSPEYRRLMDLNSHDTRAGGFPYLNSDRCNQAWTAITDETRATIEWIRDPRLREIYDLWHDTNELRDTAMVKNIEDFGLHNSFESAAFLVGAAHRKSIVEKARVGGRAGPLYVE